MSRKSSWWICPPLVLRLKIAILPVVRPGHEDQRTVGADLHAARPVEAVDHRHARAVLLAFGPGKLRSELRRRQVAAEDDHGVVVEAGDVERISGGREGERRGAGQAFVGAVELRLHEGQGAGREVAREDRDAVRGFPRHHHVAAVGRDGHRPRAAHAAHARAGVGHGRVPGQGSGRQIAREDHDRAAGRRRDVDVTPSGATAMPRGPVMAERFGSVARSMSQRGEHARSSGVRVNDLEGVLAEAGDVDLPAVRARRRPPRRPGSRWPCRRRCRRCRKSAARWSRRA